MPHDMKKNLADFVYEELLDKRVTISGSDDLLVSGLLDSLGVMRLVAHIEQKYGVRIPPEDITIEHFASVDAIAAYADNLLTS